MDHKHFKTLRTTEADAKRINKNLHFNERNLLRFQHHLYQILILFI